jgi:SAM-dependent methyltransferase
MHDPSFEILACPVCFGSARDADPSGWTCRSCGVCFPAGEVPVFVPEPGQANWALGEQEYRKALNAYYRGRLQAGDGWWLDRNEYRSLLRQHDSETYFEPLFDVIRENYRSPVVLDAGGGEGWFTNRCEREIPGYRGLLLDLSDVIVHHGKVRHGIRSEAASASLLRLPIQSGEVDVIVAIEVLEHILNPGLFFRECFRVLKTGGRLILTTPNPLSPALWYEMGGIRGLLRMLSPGACSPLRDRYADAGAEDPYRPHMDDSFSNFLIPRQIGFLADEAGFRSVTLHSSGAGFAPMIYYWAERLHLPMTLFRPLSRLFSSVDKKILFRGTLNRGKVQRVICLK